MVSNMNPLNNHYFIIIATNAIGDSLTSEPIELISTSA
jgi:hypothetical protein